MGFMREAAAGVRELELLRLAAASYSCLAYDCDVRHVCMTKNEHHVLEVLNLPQVCCAASHIMIPFRPPCAVPCVILQIIWEGPLFCKASTLMGRCYSVTACTT